MNCSVLLLAMVIAGSFASPVRSEEQSALPTGQAVIRRAAGGSDVVITATPRLAAAIHSLTWNGKEFIDSADHGRQLQSAANFDCGSHFVSETFNPTEAGSRRDGAGEYSSSRLLHMIIGGHALQTTTQMAFWLAPGERSEGHLAKNARILSDHLLTKRISIGYTDLPHVIDYQVTFQMPLGEHHTYAQFEAVTGYMPAEFHNFWSFNPASRKLEPLSDGPGEQMHPVVLATGDGSHAMGVFSPDQPSQGFEQAGYGRFRFRREGVVKWNCVFRIQDAHGVPAKNYAFRTFVLVGDLITVERSLDSLHARFRATP